VTLRFDNQRVLEDRPHERFVDASRQRSEGDEVLAMQKLWPQVQWIVLLIRFGAPSNGSHTEQETKNVLW